jgi:hypothetical protein
MSYIINPVEEDRCVFLSYEGETPVEFSTARSEANGVLDERHWNRLLVDVSRLPSAPEARELLIWPRDVGERFGQREAPWCGRTRSLTPDSSRKPPAPGACFCLFRPPRAVS